MSARIEVISGGQSGVDRAALDAACACDVPYGGWCPRNGWAEDLPHPPGVRALYPELEETPLADPAQRTEWNLRDSDATLILVTAGGLGVSSGTARAEQLATKHGKQLLVVNLTEADALDRATSWLAGQLRASAEASGVADAFKLGIGGPRESEAPGIYRQARPFIEALLRAGAQARLTMR